MKGYRFLGVGENRSARRKPTKAGIESTNQIHIQPLASCIGERKVFEHKPTRLPTGVMCHPDTEQNRPYKIPWPCRGLNWGPTAPQARTLPVCHTTPLLTTQAFSLLSCMRTFALKVRNVYPIDQHQNATSRATLLYKLKKSSTSRGFHAFDTGFYWSSKNAPRMRVLQLSSGVESEWKCCSSLLSVGKKKQKQKQKC